MDEGKTPVYVVHFTQADAAEQAQDLTSLKICTQGAEGRDRGAHRRLRVQQPVRQGHPASGCGTASACTTPGCCPKYRVLVEQLAQAGLLKVICGTDTLGVGHQRADPHRAVHAAVQVRRPEDRASSSARDFHQIAGRAGRKGFDDRGFVVAQAPEHVIENLRLEREGGARRQEGGEAQAARAQLRALGPEHVQAADRTRRPSRWSRASRCRTGCC